MLTNEQFEDYLALCQRMYDRMEHEHSWPWAKIADSTLEENLVDSENYQKNKNI